MPRIVYGVKPYRASPSVSGAGGQQPRAASIRLPQDMPLSPSSEERGPRTLAVNKTNATMVAQAQMPELWGKHPIDGKLQPFDAASDLVAGRDLVRPPGTVAVNSEISETL